ncbi:MAG: hypothetical protein AB1714_09140 [Acidobacteriota bacterium]
MKTLLHLSALSVMAVVAVLITLSDRSTGGMFRGLATFLAWSFYAGYFVSSWIMYAVFRRRGALWLLLVHATALGVGIATPMIIIWRDSHRNYIRELATHERPQDQTPPTPSPTRAFRSGPSVPRPLFSPSPSQTQPVREPMRQGEHQETRSGTQTDR